MLTLDFAAAIDHDFCAVDGSIGPDAEGEMRAEKKSEGVADRRTYEKIQATALPEVCAAIDSYAGAMRGDFGRALTREAIRAGLQPHRKLTPGHVVGGLVLWFLMQSEEERNRIVMQGLRVEDRMARRGEIPAAEIDHELLTRYPELGAAAKRIAKAQRDIDNGVSNDDDFGSIEGNPDQPVGRGDAVSGSQAAKVTQKKRRHAKRA